MLARSRNHVGVLSAATGGDLARSGRWRDVSRTLRRRRRARAASPPTSAAAGATSASTATATTRRSTPKTRSSCASVSALLARALRRGAVAPDGGHRRRARAEMGVLLLDGGASPVRRDRAPRAPGSSALNPARHPVSRRDSRASSGTSSAAARDRARRGSRRGRRASARAPPTAAGRSSRPRASTAAARASP